MERPMTYSGPVNRSARIVSCSQSSTLCASESMVLKLGDPLDAPKPRLSATKKFAPISL